MKEIKMSDHSFNMIRDFFKIEIKDKIITDELLYKLSNAPYNFKTTKEILDADLDKLHHQIIGI